MCLFSVWFVMFDVGVGVCCCSALFLVGLLCLTSVVFVGDVSFVLFCDVGVGVFDVGVVSSDLLL